MKSRLPENLVVLTAVAVILSATLFVFWQVTGFEFIRFDDPDWVTANPHLKDGLTPRSFAWALTTTYMGSWTPLAWLSHLADVELFGLSAGGHHVTSLVLHCLTSVLLFTLLKAMTGSLWRSAAVATLFAVHPLHVESVVWVSERRDVLSGLFMVLTLRAYLGYCRKPGWGRYLPVLLLFVLGLMSKQMLVTLPLVLLLLDYWPLGRVEATLPPAAGVPPCPPAPIGALLREKIPLLGAATVAGALAFFAERQFGATTSFAELSPGVRLNNSLASYVRYLADTAWPLRLSVFYPHPGERLSPWVGAGAGLLLTLVTVLSLRAFRRFPYVTVGWLWYIVMLAPVAGFIQIGDQARADRYTYLPLIGIFIAALWGTTGIAGRWRLGKVIVPALWAALLVAASLTARVQASYWRDNYSLFQRAVEIDPANIRALRQLRYHYAGQGNPPEALEYYRRALRIDPGHPLLHYDLGTMLAGEGRRGEAMEHLLEAVRIKPDFVMAHFRLGLILATMGDRREAIGHFHKAVETDPAFSAGRYEMGLALALEGDYQEAALHLSEALKGLPDLAEGHYNLAEVLTALGRSEEAAIHYQRAAALNSPPAPSPP